MRALIAAVAMTATLGAAAYAQSRQDFQLVNKTGYEISHVYVSASKKNDWEEDVLGDQTLEEGETLNVRFNGAGGTCMWDIKVTYAEDDSSAYWRDINLCQVSKVTIMYNRKTDTTSARFD